MPMQNSGSHPSFQYKSLTIFTHPEVYEPAEDTFLILDSISVDTNKLVCEIGTGTGIIALSCAQQGASVICSDINPYAVDLVNKNIQKNQYLLKGVLQVRQGDLFDVIGSDESFDIIIFNPPYLPTRLDQKVDDGGWFNTAVDGGITGLELTERFLKNISKHLKPGGKGYYIFSTQSERRLLLGYLKKFSLNDRIMSTISFENETLELHEVIR
jgi:release factor glutamine methyltransferase